MTYNDLLKEEAYSVCAEKKSALLQDLLNEMTDYHRSNCLFYDNVCRLLGDHTGSNRTLEQLPIVPVNLFKKKTLCSIPDSEIFKILTSSGTASQKPSTIYLDRQTAAWQQITLEHIVSSFIGSQRMPMLIIDSPSVLKDRKLFSARGAGILGFSIFSTVRHYALNEDMSLNLEGTKQFLDKYSHEPFLIFGFTYMIWQYFYKALWNQHLTLPMQQGILIHGGGWKKLLDLSVSDSEFKKGLSTIGHISRIHNYYGMAEQTGCIYMECEEGYFHASTYSDIRIRNLQDFHLCSNGEEGVLQLLSPMTHSYPGHSILTEDKGYIKGEDDCPCGRKGKYFKLTKRIPKAEIRGCSDTYEQ